MSFSAPAPQPDPTLTQQQLTAAAQQGQALQSGLSSDTMNVLRQFSQQSAFAKSNLTTPFSAASGGFATPLVSQTTGALVGSGAGTR